MNIDLTHEQRQAVNRTGDPIRLQDRETLKEYVLIRADVFERMRKMLETEVVDPSFFEFEEPENI